MTRHLEIWPLPDTGEQDARPEISDDESGAGE